MQIKIDQQATFFLNPRITINDFPKAGIWFE